MSIVPDAEVRRIAEGLNPDQRELILRHAATLDKQPITAEDFFNSGCELFVEFRAAQFEDGILVDPGERTWFAGAGASSSAGSSGWDDCFFQFNPLGLAVRAHLENSK